jgi:hypothetical protein
MAELSKNIPETSKIEPLSEIGYSGTQGLDLDFGTCTTDLKRRANLHSVVHEFVCEVPKCDGDAPDIEDIGGKAPTRFVRVSKSIVNSLKPKPLFI